MVYSVDVLDSSGRRTSELSGLVSGRLSEKINSPSILTVGTIERSEWEHFMPGKGFLRLIGSNGGSTRVFRIIETEISRNGGKAMLTAVAKHILYDMSEEIFAESVSCVNYTPRELAELVLGYSKFGLEVVAPTAVIPFVRFDYEPVLNCILRICSLTGAEIYLDEDSGMISLSERIGRDKGACFRLGLNLRGVTRKICVSRLVNRVYGVGGGEPPLRLTCATLSGGVDYVEDESSVEEWGLREAVYSDPTLEDVENLVLTPAMDGVYTSGLCENWTKTGNPIVSRCEDMNYCLYGRISQRVQCSEAEQGIHQNVSVGAGDIYSLSVNLFVISGTVRVQAEETGAFYKNVSPSSGSGFVTVNIENWKAISSTVTVRIVSESSAEFYVDSVQLAKGAQAKEFTVAKSVDKLCERANEFLNSRKEPEIAYNIDIVGFYSENKDADLNGFGLGDTVRVIDAGMGIDVKTRVAEREVDIVRPWHVKAGLESPGRSAADVFAALRDSYEEGIRYQRTILARSVRAGETGASRIGFSGESCRFFGTVTAVSWNGVSWSQGTLRAGEAWYSIAQGSADGLAGSSTYYFYFDRTSPGVFGWTTATSDAEGADRIMVFAVKTTGSSELCRIFPMGMVHG